MTDCDEITLLEANTWHVISMRHLTDEGLYEVINWLESMEGGKFYWSLSKNFWFEREVDRTLCVLTWG